MKKRAFTLSEVLVTLTIIGIVMAMTIPHINSVKPNKDKVFFHKSVMSVQQSLNMINLPEDNAAQTFWAEEAPSKFCDSISDLLNTAGTVNCSSTSSYESPNFVTTDGIRFWGF